MRGCGLAEITGGVLSNCFILVHVCCTVVLKQFHCRLETCIIYTQQLLFCFTVIYTKTAGHVCYNNSSQLSCFGSMSDIVSYSVYNNVMLSVTRLELSAL